MKIVRKHIFLIKVLKALQKVLLFAIAEFNFTAATNNTERILIKH